MEQEMKISPTILRDKWNIKIQKKDLMHHILETKFNKKILNDESFILTVHVENKEDENNLVPKPIFCNL
jgi:hypothetical protein